MMKKRQVLETICTKENATNAKNTLFQLLQKEYKHLNAPCLHFHVSRIGEVQDKVSEFLFEDETERIQSYSKESFCVLVFPYENKILGKMNRREYCGRFKENSAHREVFVGSLLVPVFYALV